MTKQIAEKFKEDEAQTLAQRYQPRTEREDLVSRLAKSMDPKLRQIADHCRQFDDLGESATALQEQQERELCPETEQERQPEKAKPAEPEKCVLAADVQKFAIEGILVPGSRAYMPAFEALRDSSGARSFNLANLAGNLLVTTDFARTVVKSGSSYRSDQYQRSVQWIISSRKHAANTVDTLMIISPYEANQLLPGMSRSRTTSLHLYKSRCNSGYQALDKLAIFTMNAQKSSPSIPLNLAAQLNVFAGQLYFSSFEDYQEVCRFLHMTSIAASPGWEISPNGFMLWDGIERRTAGDNPVHFIKSLMTTVRRNGQDIAKTDMGAFLEGKIFERSDFEGRS